MLLNIWGNPANSINAAAKRATGDFRYAVRFNLFGFRLLLVRFIYILLCAKELIYDRKKDISGEMSLSEV